MIQSLKQIGSRLVVPVSPAGGMGEAFQWLLFARLVLLFGALTIVSLTEILVGKKILPFHVGSAHALIALSFFITLIEALAWDFFLIGWRFIFLNIVFDASIISVALFFGHTQDSLYALLYLFQILIVSLTFYRRGALIASSVCIFLFGFISLERSVNLPDSLTVWGIYSGIFVVLGYVGGYLSEELGRTTLSLKEKNSEVERLTALQERIISDIPTGFLTIDDSSVIHFVNPAAEQILGILSRNTVGRKLDELLPELMPFFSQIESESISSDEDEGVDPRDLALSATGTEFHRSLFLRTKSELGGQARLQQTVEMGHGPSLRILRGDVAELDVKAGAGRLMDGSAKSGRVLLFQDVTKLVHLEEKLKQHEKLAAVGQLAAGIAHEIRNPLASMSASIELLKGAQEWTDPENKKLMEITLKEIDRLNGLICEFLDFVKPDKFKLLPVSLNHLLNEILQSAKGMNEFKDKATLKEKISSVEALGNEEKLKQVVWNLLLNAVQALTIPGQIEIGCERVNNQKVKFWIEDTGMGMSEETQKHLYEPFFTTKAKGTGLGLPTAYKIIEAHHGEIKVISQQGKGTRFEILLPSA